MNLDTAALMVVDVQNGFITADSAPAVPVVVKLVSAWQASDRPTIFTRFFNYKDSPYETLIGWRALYDSPETDLVADLVSFADHAQAHVLDKTVYTALTTKGLALLTDLGVKDLIICGIASDACVLKTALDAFEMGFVPWVVRDAVASNATKVPAKQVHDSALLLLSRLVGARQIVSSNDVLELLKQI